MPQPYYNASPNLETTSLGSSQMSTACPNPLTPPPEEDEQYRPVRSHSSHHVRNRGVPSPDNTAAGMAQSQEDSIYLSPAASPSTVQDAFDIEDKDRTDSMHEEYKDGMKTPMVVNTCETSCPALQSTPSLSSPTTPAPSVHDQTKLIHIQQPDCEMAEERDQMPPVTSDDHDEMTTEESSSTNVENEAPSQASGPVIQRLEGSPPTRPWTFSNRRLIPEYPSHVFQSYSEYSGTQQSDRQVYNVDVTILTVDMGQCTMTGYLLIKGLTPEHDTLQTYFTGEIIGSPSRLPEKPQPYTFRTANPAWGATEKTDLTHWARFPAWRPLSSHAKRDINFTYPVDGTDWWQQEHIFMRWKEHFLVPDHKTKSIAGASFEGFYYICLNQIQGKISGIYYHSKSEKYQQLELTHEGPPGIFNRGITPCIEFR